jgi:acyl-CoA synthetase (AMP-forming)/AMP-acid ligase II
MSAISKPSIETLASLTLPEVVEYRLKHDPNHTFTLFPSETADDKPSRITYLEFGRAVQRFARAVQSGTNLKKGEVVGLIANCDALLYITAVAGFAHAGITVSRDFLLKHGRWRLIAIAGISYVAP